MTRTQPIRRNDLTVPQVWGQKTIPVVYRATKGPLLLRLPYSKNNRALIQQDGRHNPRWNREQKYWELPRAWFTSRVQNFITHFNACYVIQEHREMEKCAPACWEAMGMECECSCLGEHHGEGNPGSDWYVISETCAVQWKNSTLSIRLYKKALP